MANIQQGINQLISMAALGAGIYSRSPAGQANSATREANRYAGAAAGYQKTISNPDAFTGTPEQQTLKRQGTQKLYQSSRDSAVASRLRAVNLKPTKSRVDSYLDSYAQQQAEIREEKAQSAASMAAQKAMARMRQMGMDQINQNKARRSFMDYLKDQGSSLGRVGDLPPAVQKEIAKNYSPSQRKKLMDAEDEKRKEENNGRKVSGKRKTNQ